jgi:hypothetical protein
MRVALCLVLVACGSRAKPPTRTEIADNDAAVAAFQAAWARDVRPKIADPLVRRIDNRMQSTDALGRYLAEPHACREGIERIAHLENAKQTSGVLEGSLVVYGTPDALLGRDRCWSVLFLGGLRNLDAEGWLDSSGRLLIAWRVPFA